MFVQTTVVTLIISPEAKDEHQRQAFTFVSSEGGVALCSKLHVLDISAGTGICICSDFHPLFTRSPIHLHVQLVIFSVTVVSLSQA